MKVSDIGAILIPKTYRKQLKEGYNFAHIQGLNNKTGIITLKFSDNEGIPIGVTGLITVPKYVRTIMKIKTGMIIEDVEFKKQSSVLICKVIY